MLTLHIAQTKDGVVIPKAEFDQLIERIKTIESVEIIEAPDEAIDVEDIEDIEIDLDINHEELESVRKKKTANFQDAIDKWLKDESSDK